MSCEFTVMPVPALVGGPLWLTAREPLPGFGAAAGSVALACGDGMEIPLSVRVWSPAMISTSLPGDLSRCMPPYGIVVRTAIGEMCRVEMTQVLMPGGPGDLCQFSMTPGSMKSAPATLPGTVVLSRNPMDPLGFGAMPGTVSLRCTATNEETRLSVVWTPSMVTVALPPALPACAGAYELVLRSEQHTCIKPIFISPVTRPPGGQLTVAELERLADQFRVVTQPARPMPAEQVTGILVPPTLEGFRFVDTSGVVPLPALPAGVPLPPGVPAPPLPGRDILDIRVAVEWNVTRDPSGTPLLAPGNDYVSEYGRNRPSESFTILPSAPDQISGGSRVIPPPQRFFLTVCVTLEAGGVSARRCLPPVPIDVSPVKVPRIAALFRHRDFQFREGDQNGAVLVFVPANSPLRLGNLVDELRQIDNLLQPVRVRIGTALWVASFLTGLGELLRAIADHQSRHPTNYMAFRFADRLPGTSFNFIDEGWGPFDDVHVQDEVSSLILLGPPGTTLQCFNGHDTNPDQGELDVRVGDNTLAALIRDLHGIRDQATANTAVQLGTATVPVEPRGRRVPAGTNTFGNEISSLQFA